MAETNKVIMLGNEAIARGAYEAGVKVSAAYPGTPSTEISEYLVQYKESLYCTKYSLISVLGVPGYAADTFTPAS